MTASGDQQDERGEGGPEGVVLIHGLGLAVQGVSMRPLARRLTQDGYAVARLAYPSYKLTLAQAEAALRRQLEGAVSGWRTVHLVGHSLGGVMAARLARALPEAKRGRVIQLGAPNLGSPLAAFAAKLPPARLMLGPALDDLSAPLPPHDCPRVAALAGDTSWGPARAIPPRWGQGFSGRSDGKVAVESALAFAEERGVVPIGHAFLPTSRRVADAVACCLREGRFPEGVHVDA